MWVAKDEIACVPKQMQGLASGMGTFLGTCIRIPCEVLKQRLQTGKHPNMLQVTPSALSQNV